MFKWFKKSKRYVIVELEGLGYAIKDRYQNQYFSSDTEDVYLREQWWSDWKYVRQYCIFKTFDAAKQKLDSFLKPKETIIHS